jgi:S-(hydroxymethyl)glutathione dehydrogenase/alcohol dehydrogenase
VKAVVFHKPKDVRVEQVPEPKLEHPRDAIVRVTSTAICGTDLHIFNGLFRQTQPLTLGHEFMGIVEEVGRGVDNLHPGDRVVVPFPVACGQCWFCSHHLPTACANSNPDHDGQVGGIFRQRGGGLFGYTDLYGGAGGQAEVVRVPFADYGPRRVPEDLADEQVLFLTDIFPTGWAALDWAQLKGGETVVVFGCGPVGIMAQKAAWLQGAGRVIGVDIEAYRLAAAKRTAASEVIDASDVDPVDVIRDITHGRGADVCVDAVGMGAASRADGSTDRSRLPAGSTSALAQAFAAVRRGGTVTIVGVYGSTHGDFPLGLMVDKALRVRAGQAPVHNYIDHLLSLIQKGAVRIDDIISHIMPLSDAPLGYQLFNERKDNCVKVVLKPSAAQSIRS